jgi:hypothetical protein
MRLKTSLIVQEGVMIPQGETPVLELNSTDKVDVLSLVPPTVRFLRCGCPSVQWLITTGNFFRVGPKTQDEVRAEVEKALSRLFISLEFQ